jgi:hypothetical protein
MNGTQGNPDLPPIDSNAPLMMPDLSVIEDAPPLDQPNPLGQSLPPPNFNDDQNMSLTFEAAL